VSETTSASDIHPDITGLAQQIVDKVHELVAAVETLDANKWLNYADDIDALNSQLQALLIPAPAKAESTSSSSTKSQKAN